MESATTIATAEAQADMLLDESQQAAVEMVQGLDHGRIGIIAGVAGSGKTTTLRTVLCDTDARLLAPTGRAALRASDAAGRGASTIHRWLYIPREDGDGRVHFKRRELEELELPASGLVVVDEASMVGREVFLDLWQAVSDRDGRLVLVGDHEQLPPVGDGGYSVFGDEFAATFKPERRVLARVHRQALGSSVLRAATLVRTGHITDGLQELRAVSASKLLDEAASTIEVGGLVVCHRNVTRHALNAALRTAFDRDGPVSPGEPVLVMRNNYEVGAMNGEVLRFDGWAGGAVQRKLPRTDLTMHFAEGQVSGRRAVLCIEELMGAAPGEPRVMQEIAQVAARYGRELVGIDEDKRFDKREDDDEERGVPYLSAGLGYAMTVHKAQGGEASRVLVLLEPSIRFDTADPQRADEARRWLYTAITRAKERCSIYKGDLRYVQPARKRYTLPELSC